MNNPDQLKKSPENHEANEIKNDLMNLKNQILMNNDEIKILKNTALTAYTKAEGKNSIYMFNVSPKSTLDNVIIALLVAKKKINDPKNIITNKESANKYVENAISILEQGKFKQFQELIYGKNNTSVIDGRIGTNTFNAVMSALGENIIYSLHEVTILGTKDNNFTPLTKMESLPITGKENPEPILLAQNPIVTEKENNEDKEVNEDKITYFKQDNKRGHNEKNTEVANVFINKTGLSFSNKKIEVPVIFKEDPLLTELMEGNDWTYLFDPQQKITFDFITKNYSSLSKNEEIEDQINYEIITYVNDMNKNNTPKIRLIEKILTGVSGQINPITGEYYFDIPVTENIKVKKSDKNINTIHLYSNKIVVNEEILPAITTPEIISDKGLTPEVKTNELVLDEETLQNFDKSPRKEKYEELIKQLDPKWLNKNVDFMYGDQTVKGTIDFVGGVFTVKTPDGLGTNSFDIFNVTPNYITVYGEGGKKMRIINSSDNLITQIIDIKDETPENNVADNTKKSIDK